MKNCKPSFTPMEVNVKISRDMCPQTLEEKKNHGQNSILKCSGLFGIHHNLYPTVYHLCGWNHKPISRRPGCQALECYQEIMRYLHGTIIHGVHYGPSTNGKGTHVVGIVPPIGQVTWTSVNQHCFLLGQGAIIRNNHSSPFEYGGEIHGVNKCNQTQSLQHLC